VQGRSTSRFLSYSPAGTLAETNFRKIALRTPNFTCRVKRIEKTLHEMVYLECVETRGTWQITSTIAAAAAATAATTTAK
jgi:hypothetical protein